MSKNTLAPQILIVTTSWDKLGETGRKTGLFLEEFTTPYYIFLDAGYEVVVASPKGGAVPIDPSSLGEDYQTESTRRYMASPCKVLENSLKLADCKTDDYAAVFYPGGHGPMWDLATDPTNARLIEHMDAAGKIIGAVCHGPAALLSAKTPEGHPFIRDKRISAFSNAEEEAVGLQHAVPFSLEDNIKVLGGQYSCALKWLGHHTVDGNLVTGQNPQSAVLVGQSMVELLQAQNSCSCD